MLALSLTYQPPLQAILARKVRKYLIDNIDENGNFGTASKEKAQNSPEASDASSSESEEDEDGNRKMQLRRRNAVDYDTVDDDEEFFRRAEDDGRNSSSPTKRKRVPARGRMKKEKTDAQLGREFAIKEASTSPSSSYFTF